MIEEKKKPFNGDRRFKDGIIPSDAWCPLINHDGDATEWHNAKYNLIIVKEPEGWKLKFGDAWIPGYWQYAGQLKRIAVKAWEDRLASRRKEESGS